LPSVGHPTAKRRAVEASNDWDIDRRFRLGDVAEVRFRANLELGRPRKISQRLRITFRALIEVVLQLMVIATKLLLEK